MPSLSVTHLNDDTSWLITWKDGPRDPPFHLVLDPWLTGSQVDYVPCMREFYESTHIAFESWIFSKQTHVVPPAFPSLSSLQDSLEGGDGGGEISCILLTHEFTDHTHRETLSTTPSRRIPVFGHPNAVQRVKGWEIFEGPVVPVRIYKRASKESALPDSLAELLTRQAVQGQQEPPPASSAAAAASAKEMAILSNVGVLYIPTDSRLDPAGDKLHGLTVLTFTARAVGEQAVQSGGPTATTYSVLYSPHGIPTSALQPTFEALHSLQNHECVALIHGFDNIRIPLLGKVNLGRESGTGIVETLRPTYWLRTHDELKEKKGIVGATLKREQWTADEVQSEVGAGTRVRVLESGERLELLR